MGGKIENGRLWGFCEIYWYSMFKVNQKRLIRTVGVSFIC